MQLKLAKTSVIHFFTYNTKLIASNATTIYRYSTLEITPRVYRRRDSAASGYPL